MFLNKFLILGILLILQSCAKEPKKIEKIDFLCEECQSEQRIQTKEESGQKESKKKDIQQDIAEPKAPAKKPLIFEYDALKEELNVRTYEEMFDKAMQFYSNGEIETAVKIFRVLVDNSPNKEYREVVMFNLAIGIERLGNENEALKIYESLTASENYDIKEDSVLRSTRIKLAQGKEVKINPAEFSDERRKRFAQTILLLDKTEKILGELLNKTQSLGILNNTNSELKETKSSKELKKQVESIWSEINKILINPTEENETKTILYLCRGNIQFIEAILIPNDNAENIKKKVRKLIEAQREYFSAVKERHPWWMTAGVFKIGETYRYLFEDITSSPIPKELRTEEEKQIYIAELLKEIKRALDLAQNIYEKNINFSQRTKMKTVWITRSEEEIGKIKHYTELVQKFIESIENEGKFGIDIKETEHSPQ
ncbi:MAG: hypothetical protein NZ927_05715 [Candidatus Calescibacterium sp.]|nr:hypothetical protein [Candidatus Calescibacterium sp.]MCX7734207.1 hypothetical protein [bacterium]MDW8086531.1 hypothetical protein [Candidatus Calescibacterium sp.]